MEIFFLHSVEYPFGPLLAFLQGFHEYQDIVHVDDQPPFSDYVSKGGIHERLEGGQGVALPKEHNQGFIKTEGSGKSGFPFISLFDSDVIVPPSYVHFGEILGSFQFVDEGGDEGEWVSVLD